MLNIVEMDEDADDGYIYEVDLKYPHHLHDLHNDYPLAPERLSINETMLSPLQQQFPKNHKKTTTKLAPNLTR